MQKITKENIQDYALKLMFKMKDDEFEAFEKEFETILKQMDLIGQIEGIENVESDKVGFNQVNKKFELDIKSIQKYGIIPELLGRLPIVCTLDKLKYQDFVDILTKPTDSIVKEYIDLLKISNVDLEFSDEALNEIAVYAYKNRLGARALRQIMEKIMLDYMFNIDNYFNNKILIDKDVVKTYY